MNINEIELSQAMSVELLLEQKIKDFFGNPENEVIIFQASISKDASKNLQVETIETLIALIRENIAVGQIKRALKFMIVLEFMINKVKC
jgi:hypothetical protein